jgi:hypothetical protein
LAARKKKKVGRPSLKTPKMLERITTQMAQGRSLHSICRDGDMPAIGTVLRWVGEDEVFRRQYEAARQQQADSYFEQIVGLTDEANLTQGSQGKVRLQVDSRKWVIARMNRAKYGDQSNLNIGGQADAPPVQSTTVTADLTQLNDSDLAKLREMSRSVIQGGDDGDE